MVGGNFLESLKVAVGEGSVFFSVPYRKFEGIFVGFFGEGEVAWHVERVFVGREEWCGILEQGMEMKGTGGLGSVYCVAPFGLERGEKAFERETSEFFAAVLQRQCVPRWPVVGLDLRETETG